MSNILNFLVKSLLIVSVFAGRTKDQPTKFLMVLARHGARYPLAAGVSQNQQGELTENGLRMCYLLGKYIRKTFSDFFPQKFDYNKNWIMASGYPRTQMSAQAVMLGIYDFGSLNEELKVDKKYYTPEWEGFNIDDKLKTPLPEGFQPIPVHSFQSDENFLFNSFNFDLCPKFKSYAMKSSDKEGQELLKLANELIDEIKKTGFNVKEIIGSETLDNAVDFYILADYIVASKFIGKDFGFDEKLYQKIYLMYSMTMYYAFFKDSEFTKYQLTELGRAILGYIEQAKTAISKKDAHFTEFVLLNGHDINLFNFLALSKLTSYECLKNAYLGQPSKDNCYQMPAYAASIFFEMFENNGDLMISTFYNGEEIDFCSSKSDTKACSVNEFVTKFKTLLLNDEVSVLRTTYCVEPEMSKNTMMLAILGFNVGVILVLSFLIFRFKKRASAAE